MQMIISTTSTTLTNANDEGYWADVFENEIESYLWGY